MTFLAIRFATSRMTPWPLPVSDVRTAQIRTVMFLWKKQTLDIGFPRNTFGHVCRLYHWTIVTLGIVVVIEHLELLHKYLLQQYNFTLESFWCWNDIWQLKSKSIFNSLIFIDIQQRNAIPTTVELWTNPIFD